MEIQGPTYCNPSTIAYINGTRTRGAWLPSATAIKWRNRDVSITVFRSSLWGEHTIRRILSVHITRTGNDQTRLYGDMTNYRIGKATQVAICSP